MTFEPTPLPLSTTEDDNILYTAILRGTAALSDAQVLAALLQEPDLTRADGNQRDSPIGSESSAQASKCLIISSLSEGDLARTPSLRCPSIQNWNSGLGLVTPLSCTAKKRRPNGV